MQLSKAPDKESPIEFQLIAVEATPKREPAPATINPAPKGTLIPVKAKNAPITTEAPPSIPVTLLTTFCKSSGKAFQFVPIES